MQNFMVSRCLFTEEIAEQIKSEPRTQDPEHTQAALYNKGCNTLQFVFNEFAAMMARGISLIIY